MSDYFKNVVNKVNSDPRWELLEYLYNKNYLNKTDKTVQKIPKIIHQIWLGSSFPDKYINLKDEMMEINSNWKYKLWTDKEIESFGLKNSELFNNISNLGAKSDILRYEILERIGGLYIDIDFKSVKPFDSLCYLDFFAGNGHIIEPHIINSLIACSPKNKFISKIVSELSKKKHFIDDINGVMDNTGPYFITENIFNMLTKNDNLVIFPTKFFFPFPAKYRHKVNNSPRSWKFINKFCNENTYAIHLWHTNWQ
jgi:inositol phosphorylceramide mannosyltransferase catalytic subunit